MAHDSYTVISPSEHTSLGKVEKVLSLDGQIHERLYLDSVCDTEGFRGFIRFLHSRRLVAFPRIVSFFRENNYTVLITDSHDGISLRQYLSAAKVQSEVLDSWWNQLTETLEILHANGFAAGNLSVDDIFVDNDGHLRLSLYSTQRRPDGIDFNTQQAIAVDNENKTALEAFMQAALQGESLENIPVPEVAYPRSRRSVDETTVLEKESPKRVWRLGLGFALAGLIFVGAWLSGVLSVVDIDHENDPELNLTTELVNPTIELREELLSSPEELLTALDTVNTPRDITSLSDEDANNIVTALGLLRDDAINHLKQAQYQSLTVVASPAAIAENRLFQALIAEGNRVQGYRTKYDSVQVVKRGEEWIEVKAQISQGKHLRCANECVEVAELPVREVRLKLFPSPWRIAEINAGQSF